MKIITRMLETELYETSNEAGHTISIDMREAGVKQGQSPTELLLSAVAGCSAVDVVIILQKRKKTIDNFIIETTGTRRDETPRKFTAIHCKYTITSPDINEDELSKAVALSMEKYCSVAASLNSAITYSVEVNKNNT
jgi:putative redox protein